MLIGVTEFTLQCNMFSKKLHSIIKLIKREGTISSVNDLGKLVEEEKVCVRKTVFNLLHQIKDHESINFEIVKGQDTFTYVDVSKKDYLINNELDEIDSIINELEFALKAFQSASRKGLSKDTKLSFGGQGVNARRKNIRAQQKMVHLESLGLHKGINKPRFERTKSKLVNLNLNIQKALVRLHKETAVNVFIRIDYEHHPQYTSDYGT